MIKSSNDPTEYLVNKKVLLRSTGPVYETATLHSERRPVTPIPEVVRIKSPGDLSTG